MKVQSKSFEIMEPANFADIIFFAIVAGVILLKLRATLGRKDGMESLTPPTKNHKKDNVLTFPNGEKKPTNENEIKKEEIDPELAKKLASVIEKDKTFNVAHFLNGTKSAFEIVLKAFSEGDKNTLKNMLAADVYKAFEKEIDKLAKLKHIAETTLISILSANIVKATVSRNKARIETEFVSEQICLTKDESGKIIGGDPSQTNEVTDNWIFEKDIGSANPNWLIVST